MLLKIKMALLLPILLLTAEAMGKSGLLSLFLRTNTYSIKV